MRLTEILSPDCIKVPMTATDKKGAIAEMIDVAAAVGKISDREALLQATLEREATRTTGIGNGLAIPHGKSSAVTALVMAMGKAGAPIDFDSIDGKPVTLIIFLASPPDKAGPHIQALARISRLMTDSKFRLAMDKAASADEIFDLIRAYEDNQSI